MKIAVLSGKGGTGKTLISVNMAATAENSVYIDCDVEAPNGHLFFKPVDVSSEKVYVNIPIVDHSLCNGCRICIDFCKFNALAYIGGKIKIFEDVCHSCGGCSLLCNQKAIKEIKKPIGEVQTGVSGNVKVRTGIMNIGEVSGVPLIKKLLSIPFSKDDLIIIDCPPGSACTVMESIKEADYCILVGESTIFGAHNLQMVYELVTLFHKPYSVVLNKYTDKDNPTEQFCNHNHIPVLGKILFDHELGNLNSNAEIASRENNDFRSIFETILKKAMSEVNR